MKKRELGIIGENMAVEFLINENYKILERNFRCKCGEIDIVAEKDDVITFVEVKTRRSFRYGSPCEAITAEKQRHLKRAASYYTSYVRPHYNGLTIDVIEIYINHIENAI